MSENIRTVHILILNQKLFIIRDKVTNNLKSSRTGDMIHEIQLVQTGKCYKVLRRGPVYTHDGNPRELT